MDQYEVVMDLSSIFISKDPGENTINYPEYLNIKILKITEMEKGERSEPTQTKEN